MTERDLGDGTHAGVDVDAEADGGDGRHDVGEQDRGVDAVAAHRLQRDLGGEVGPADGVADGALAAEGAVLGEVPARLALEPDRGVTGRQASRRTQVGAVLQRVDGVAGGEAGGEIAHRADVIDARGPAFWHPSAPHAAGRTGATGADQESGGVQGR